MNVLYLDNAATSWPKPERVYQAVDRCLRTTMGSPGRGSYSNAASTILFEAREAVAELCQTTDSSRVVFTLNATDGLNAAIFGVVPAGGRIITTAMEHNAVARPLRSLIERGICVEIVPCDPRTGRVDEEKLRRLLAEPVAAVVVQHASNVTGCLQPLSEIRQLTAAAGACLIVDAAQTAGEWFALHGGGGGAHEIVCLSGHKGLLGPPGTGVMIVGEAVQLRPWRYGGTGSASESDRQPDFYPDHLESGTPNTPGIAGLLAGVRHLQQADLRWRIEHKMQLTRQLIRGLQEIPGLRLIGPGTEEPRVDVVSFMAEEMDSGRFAQRLYEEHGIVCRGGLHCAPWAHQTLGTQATGTVRLSPSAETQSTDIDRALAAIRQVAKDEGI